MIRSYKLFADAGNVHVVLLEYGSMPVTVELVGADIEKLGLPVPDTTPLKSAIDAGRTQRINLHIPSPENFPGACWVMVQPDKSINVFLSPASGSGRNVSQSDINREIMDAGFGDYTRLDDIILNAIQALISNPQITSIQAVLPKNAEFKAEIAKDRKTASITFTHARGGSSIDFNIALVKLREAGVVSGLDENKIREVLDLNHDVSGVVIATGSEPVNGTDASIKFHFDAFGKDIGPRIKDNDLADYRELGVFKSIEKNSVLVEKTPATNGIDGMDVCGQLIKAKKGNDIAIPRGKNTNVNPQNPNELLSSVTGTPKLSGGKVNVEEILTVQDVDFSTGNLDFSGNVLIKGVVTNGFTVIAGGDLICSDVVEGANLTAGGNVVLKHGIKGLGKSVIRAGKDVVAGFIERCEVHAGGSIIVDEALIYSTSFAGDRIEATGSKGSIFGGQAMARNLVKAAIIGSEMAIKTVIEVGTSAQLKNRMMQMKSDLAVKQSSLLKASKNLAVLNGKLQRGELPESRNDLYNSLVALVEQLENEIKALHPAISDLERELAFMGDGKVEAVKVIHPGVTIEIKSCYRRIDEAIQKATFIKENEEIILSSELAKASTK